MTVAASVGAEVSFDLDVPARLTRVTADHVHVETEDTTTVVVLLVGVGTDDGGVLAHVTEHLIMRHRTTSGDDVLGTFERTSTTGYWSAYTLPTYIGFEFSACDPVSRDLLLECLLEAALDLRVDPMCLETEIRHDDVGRTGRLALEERTRRLVDPSRAVLEVAAQCLSGTRSGESPRLDDLRARDVVAWHRQRFLPSRRVVLTYGPMSPAEAADVAAAACSRGAVSQARPRRAVGTRRATTAAPGQTRTLYAWAGPDLARDPSLALAMRAAHSAALADPHFRAAVEQEAPPAKHRLDLRESRFLLDFDVAVPTFSVVGDRDSDDDDVAKIAHHWQESLRRSRADAHQFIDRWARRQTSFGRTAQPFGAVTLGKLHRAALRDGDLQMAALPRRQAARAHDRLDQDLESALAAATTSPLASAAVVTVEGDVP